MNFRVHDIRISEKLGTNVSVKNWNYKKGNQMKILNQTKKKIADKFNGRSVYVEANMLLRDFKDCECVERCTEFLS